MKARFSLSALVAVAAALSLSLSANAANRPHYGKMPVTHWWTSAHIDHHGPTVVRAHWIGSETIRPNPEKWGSIRLGATAGWTRAAA